MVMKLNARKDSHIASTMNPPITSLYHTYLDVFIKLRKGLPVTTLDHLESSLHGIRPIPVTSRLPHSEDLDTLGRCWCHKETTTSELNHWQLRKLSATCPVDSHWMPFWAISNQP